MRAANDRAQKELSLGMILLGKKGQIIGVEHWPVIRIYKRPTKLPAIPKGCEIIGGLDQGDGERMFICESLHDMQALYHEYAIGSAVSILWYQKPIPPSLAS